ncbi:MAG: ThuA domain-containing protein [Candidatus Hydrogenedens sp.]|nr:ThuA domain-containing protein [Candidatus Hydrogenedens sp.]
MRKWITAGLAAAAMLCPSAWSEDGGLKVLFLTKSSGFQHSVITRENDAPAYAERIMTDLVEKDGGTVLNTKDASLINAENLKNYDVVVFYTTGDLTQPGTDGTTPMAETGPQELLDWIGAGGGFVGFHCASDTFHGEGDTVTPYIEMIGGEFAGHGPQFFGKVGVKAPEHPCMEDIPGEWKIKDEWYYFKNFNAENNRVLAELDPGEQVAKAEGDRHPAYAQGPYPIAWCRAYGKGRVFYNAMGHREEVWDEEIFQKGIVDALHWAAGEGDADAAPSPKPAK